MGAGCEDLGEQRVRQRHLGAVIHLDGVEQPAAFEVFEHGFVHDAGEHAEGQLAGDGKQLQRLALGLAQSAQSLLDEQFERRRGVSQSPVELPHAVAFHEVVGVPSRLHELAQHTRISHRGLDELGEAYGFHRTADHAVEQRLGRVRAKWRNVERSQMTILDEQGDGVVDAFGSSQSGDDEDGPRVDERDEQRA